MESAPSRSASRTRSPAGLQNPPLLSAAPRSPTPVPPLPRDPNTSEPSRSPTPAPYDTAAQVPYYPSASQSRSAVDPAPPAPSAIPPPPPSPPIPSAPETRAHTQPVSRTHDVTFPRVRTEAPESSAPTTQPPPPCIPIHSATHAESETPP